MKSPGGEKQLVYLRTRKDSVKGKQRLGGEWGAMKWKRGVGTRSHRVPWWNIWILFQVQWGGTDWIQA